MASVVPSKKMKRSKSLDSLAGSWQVYRSENESYGGDDSGVQSHDGFLSLDRKVDKLSEICAEQTRLLTDLASQVQGRSAGDELGAVLAELLDKLAEERFVILTPIEICAEQTRLLTDLASQVQGRSAGDELGAVLAELLDKLAEERFVILTLIEICAEQTRLLADLASQVQGRSAGDELGAVLAELLDKLAEERFVILSPIEICAEQTRLLTDLASQVQGRSAGDELGAVLAELLDKLAEERFVILTPIEICAEQTRLLTDLASQVQGRSAGDELGAVLAELLDKLAEERFVILTPIEICAEKTRLLTDLASQVQGRSAGDELGAVLAELLDELAEESEKTGESGARSLLNAIEARPSLERRVGAALTDLLQSEDLKQRIVSSTTESIKELIRNLFSMEVSSLYVPVMERAHSQLLKHVTKMVATAFADLEENTACNAEALRQTSQSLQAALQRHESLLKQACDGSSRIVDAVTSTTEKVVERELKQWREEVSNAMPPMSECDSGRADSPDLPCASPDVNDNTAGGSGLSPIDRMMITAEVKMLIRSGDINGAFSRALLAAELDVVMAACRAVPVSARPALAQPVLLSLLQQLATDLLLDTPLKCSYMEYALVCVSPSGPATRAHLPLVVGELRRHLSAFLDKYPHHLQAHRIAAIIQTAEKLL